VQLENAVLTSGRVIPNPGAVQPGESLPWAKSKGILRGPRLERSPHCTPDPSLRL